MEAGRIAASAAMTSDEGRHDTWTARYIETRQGLTEGAERDRVAGFGRLEDGLRQGGEGEGWGPDVGERQWGRGGEDYSADGTAWHSLPHDRARPQAYRWGEDGLAGFCDIEQG